MKRMQVFPGQFIQHWQVDRRDLVNKNSNIQYLDYHLTFAAMSLATHCLVYMHHAALLTCFVACDLTPDSTHLRIFVALLQSSSSH